MADGLRSIGDGVVDVPPSVVVQQGDVAALGAEYLGELAEVKLAGVAAGRRAGPEPVAAADDLVGRELAGDGFGDAVAGGAAVAGRTQHLVESFDVAQVEGGVGPAEPGDPGKRLGRGSGEPFLLVPLPATRAVESDRSGVAKSAHQLAEQNKCSFVQQLGAKDVCC